MRRVYSSFYNGTLLPIAVVLPYLFQRVLSMNTLSYPRQCPFLKYATLSRLAFFLHVHNFNVPSSALAQADCEVTRVEDNCYQANIYVMFRYNDDSGMYYYKNSTDSWDASSFIKSLRLLLRAVVLCPLNTCIPQACTRSWCSCRLCFRILPH